MSSIDPMEFVNELYGKLRVWQEDSGELWFSASDILKTLGLDRSALRRVDPGDRNPGLFEARRTAAVGGNRRSDGVSEAGLYLLVLSSRKPKAVGFRQWLTHEVLPSIRRSGGYLSGQESLPEEDRILLEERVRTLAGELEKAKSGKAKLSAYLAAEEDRVFDLREELRLAEKEILDLKEKLGDPETLETQLALLLRKREEQHRRQEEKQAAARERRKTAPVSDNPYVFDSRGNLMRRNEFISMDRK